LCLPVTRGAGGSVSANIHQLVELSLAVPGIEEFKKKKKGEQQTMGNSIKNRVNMGPKAEMAGGK
jgi:hypothetical protein